MAMLCVCGVCIPYSAILPLLALLLRYMAEPLAKMKMLLKKCLHWAGLSSAAAGADDDCSSSMTTSKASSCCRLRQDETTSIKTPVAVTCITSMEQWEEHHSKYDIIICKFTATWCKPCKVIEPHYQLLAEQYCTTTSSSTSSQLSVLFVKVDVDEMDFIASKYNVAIMPTFLVFKNKEKQDSMCGSNEIKLEQFIRKHVETFSSETTKKDN